MRKIFKSCFIVSVLFFSGCMNVANKDDLDILKTEIDQKITALQEDHAKKYQELNTAISQLQQQQSQQQTLLTSFSEEMKNQLKDLRIAFDDTLQVQNKELETFKKNQEEKNIQLGRDIEFLKSSQNEFMRTSATLTEAMAGLQRDILAVKTSLQQIATEIDAMEGKKFVQQQDIVNLKKYYDAQIDTLLNEIVRQESEIFRLKQVIQTEQVSSSRTVSDSAKYHIVQKGETLSGIAKKYNISIGTLKEANKMKDDKVFIGQRLLIP